MPVAHVLGRFEEKLALQLNLATGMYFYFNVGKFVLYMIYGTRAVVSCLIKHSASPRALSAT